MWLAGPSLGRELRARALSHTPHRCCVGPLYTLYKAVENNSGSQSRLQTALTAHTTDGRLGLHINASGPCMNSTSAKLFLDLPTICPARFRRPLTLHAPVSSLS